MHKPEGHKNFSGTLVSREQKEQIYPKDVATKHIYSKKGQTTMEKREMSIRTQEAKVEEVRAMYEEMLADATTDKRRAELVDELMEFHKPDGSFSIMDDYHVDSDAVVYFGLIPTYSATAALVYADLKGIKTKKSEAALLRGLKFAAELRGFIGHGFDATHDLLEAIGIYKRAGIYKWLRQNEDKAPEFRKTLRKRVMEMKEALAQGRVYSDWERNFTVEFTQEVEDFERENYEYVWYVSYGSNLSYERFMRYINRCTDTTEPVENKAKTFDFSLYFATKSSIWGNGKGGSAFIDTSKTGLTHCRMYKIKRSQFEEVMAMEGPKYTRKIDLDPRMSGDCPCYTFTSPTVYEEKNAPSKEYFDTILTGLKEMYPEASENILRFYLFSRCLTNDDLTALRQIKCSEHALKTGEIRGIRTKKKLTDSLQRLETLGLIVEDTRSKNAGLKLTDYEALVYTANESREIIDMLIIASMMERGDA